MHSAEPHRQLLRQSSFFLKYCLSSLGTFKAKNVHISQEHAYEEVSELRILYQLGFFWLKEEETLVSAGINNKGIAWI